MDFLRYQTEHNSKDIKNKTKKKIIVIKKLNKGNNFGVITVLLQFLRNQTEQNGKYINTKITKTKKERNNTHPHYRKVDGILTLRTYNT